jgi:hypothetical protein
MIKKVRVYSRAIAVNTLKLLLARSGNQCAFPGCQHPVFNDEGLFIAQLCHIEGVAPLSQRHNINKSDKETNSYENLLFLCYRHHIETDNVKMYPVEKLIEIKALHEAKFSEGTYEYSSKVLKELVKEINFYWQKIEKLHAHHVVPELAVPIDVEGDILKLIDEINESLNSLSDLNSVFMDDLMETHFEFVCLAIPNFLTRSSVALIQIKIKYIEELLIKNPVDQNLQTTLKHLRNYFESIVQSVGLID